MAGRVGGELNRVVEEGAEGFFVFLRHSTLSPLGIHVDRSEPDVI